MLSSFSGFMVFGMMSIVLLLGVCLRAKIPFLQKTMIPASLIGGFIGLVLVNMGWLKFQAPGGDWYTLTSKHFLPYTFHAFNISFISLCLTRSETMMSRSKILKGGMWMTLVWTASLSLQLLMGGGTVWLYDLFTGGDINVFLGCLSAMGFTQGPGQGIAIGTLFQNNFGIEDAISMGLIWGTMGFIAAYVAGIPYARSFIKKGMNTNKRSVIDEEFMTGLLKKETHISAGRETTHSSNLDTLSFHMALVGLAYVLAYIEIGITSKLIHHFLFSYPVFFLHGLFFAIVIRKAAEMMGVGHLADPGIQKRITGMSVDFLIVASIMGISMGIVNKYIGIIILVTLVITITTYLFIEFFRKRVSNLGPERAVAQFGCCCGSTASGLLLLRMLDADYSTSVGMELAFFNIAIVAMALPMLTLLIPVLPSLGFWTIVPAFGLNTLVCFGFLWWLGPRCIGEEAEALAA